MVKITDSVQAIRQEYQNVFIWLVENVRYSLDDIYKMNLVEFLILINEVSKIQQRKMNSAGQKVTKGNRRGE